MTFGEKVRDLRLHNKLSQAELGSRIGVSMRTIISYEQGKSYPKSRDVYDKLADVFGVDVNYLKAENEDFMSDVSAQYGSRGVQQAEKILEQTRTLFAGGSLSEEDELAFMRELQEIFFESKQIAKKFTPKKYLKNTSGTEEQ